MLSRATGEQLAFDSSVAKRVTACVRAAATGEHAVEDVGSLLKLIHVLRVKHRSPGAAKRLVDDLRSSPAARRIIQKHWSTARRARLNADLTPIQTATAPRQDAKAPPGSIKALEFLTPGQDPRAQRANFGRKKTP